MRLFYTSLLISISSLLLSAQSIEGFWGDIRQRIQQKDIFRISGQLSGQLQFNSISGIDRRQPGLNGQLFAGLNLDLIGIQIPTSLAISRGGAVYNYRLPRYTFVGISPTYKWIKLHAGDRSMSFSPYVLSGLSFRGVGIELSPDKFQFSALYGRLRRAQVSNAGSIQNVESRYQRLGGGTQLAYIGEKSEVRLSVFAARDKVNSLDPNSIDSLDTPEANLCVGIGFNQQLSERLQFQAEWAISALTRDQRQADLIDATAAQRFLGLFQPKTSTAYFQAYNFGVQFQPGIVQMGLQFERVDPGYRTLGALYFQNDLENITAQLGFPFAAGKFNLQFNTGLQRNNLRKQAGVTGFNRFIGALNLSAQWSERISSQLALSNFNTTNRVRAINIPFVEIDSLLIVQTNKAVNWSNSVQLDLDAQHLLTTNFSYQSAQTVSNDSLNGSSGDSRFLLGLLAYVFHPRESKTTFTASIMAHQNRLATGSVFLLGPSLGYQRSFGTEDQLNLRLSLAYSRVQAESVAATGLLRLQLAGGYSLAANSQLALSAAFVDNSAGVNPFKEITIGLRYKYQFGTKAN